MEKLELKHLVPYLPYELGIGSCHSHNEKRRYSELKLTNDYGLSNGVGDLINGKTIWGTFIKPILRPLSDLTKDIEHNGKKFEPFEMLQEEFNNSIELNSMNYNKSFFIKLDSFVRFDDMHRIYEYLFKWHFDVFGLIEKGLAIDINTL